MARREDRARIEIAFCLMRRWWALAVGLFPGIVILGVAGCSGANRCVPGASVECSCPNGRRSAQVCAPEGTFLPCQCFGLAVTPPANHAPEPTPPPPRDASPPGLECPENQVPIPGGTFWMGDQDLDKSKPVHKVALSPYCIDKTEVTVAAYRACVQAGICPPASATVDWKGVKPEDKTKWSQFCTWGKRGFDRHPINCVDWTQANAYCASTGGRLPTEAEWEYAARGSDGRSYPWGNKPPDATRLNACGSECASMAQQRLEATWTPMYTGDDGWPATAPVGRYPKGASPFGVLDMAGNVQEWTADAFADYNSDPVTNPRRSSSDESPRVIRGGSWISEVADKMRATFRSGFVPGYRINSLGFRCARGERI
ncbi:MAG: formylglycine-generating enzyme family protein [Polyangia bacterium]